MQEEWRAVPGYPGVEVSSFGQVRNQGRVLGQTWLKGYRRVHLTINGKDKSLRVHRLIAAAFITNPDKKPHVNHIDFDRAHNAPSNLEWCTPLENTRHSVRAGRYASIKRRKLSAEQVKAIRSLPFVCPDTAKQYGIHRSNIRRIRAGQAYAEIN